MLIEQIDSVAEQATSGDPLVAFFTILAGVFIAELGDKTQIAALVLSTGKGRAGMFGVFIGASLALVACSVVAVLAGAALQQMLTPDIRASVAAGPGRLRNRSRHIHRGSDWRGTAARRATPSCRSETL